MLLILNPLHIVFVLTKKKNNVWDVDIFGFSLNLSINWVVPVIISWQVAKVLAEVKEVDKSSTADMWIFLADGWSDVEQNIAKL